MREKDELEVNQRRLDRLSDQKIKAHKFQMVFEGKLKGNNKYEMEVSMSQAG